MQPINLTRFGLLAHRAQVFQAETPPGLSNDELTNPELWTSVGPRCRPGDQIRCLAEDYSYEALLTVTYSAGQRMRVKLIWRQTLDEVPETDEEENAPFFVKQRGVEKWCIIERATGEVKVKDIPTKLEAMKYLEDYLRALAA